MTPEFFQNKWKDEIPLSEMGKAMGRSNFRSKRLRGGEDGELLVNGSGGSVWGDEKVLEVDGSDG